MTKHSTTKTLSSLADLVEPGQDTTYATHGLHPYPAKFIPQIPAAIIRRHTNERHVVFDPFCGSGTTLLEALLSGRRSIGCDSNPIAALVSRAKTTPLRKPGLEEALRLLSKCDHWPNLDIPEVPAMTYPRLEHWFTHQVTLELSALKFMIEAIEDAALQQLTQCVFSSIIVSVSNQESDTRYAAITKSIKPGAVFAKFSSKLRRALVAISAVNDACKHDYLVPEVRCADIRSIDSETIADNCADLVVTSPPYANSFDYYLYHKWRMVWLGFNPTIVRNEEIGSRYEHSSQKASLQVFEDKMAQALSQVGRALKPSKLAYFLVGDSILSGELIDSEESLKRSAEKSGLRFLSAISYPLAKVSRSFREKTSEGCHGGAKDNKKQQRVLVFESVTNSLVSPYRTAISSRAKPMHEEVALKGIVPNGSRIALKSEDGDRHVHSLARYPSKFVPLLPRWAIDTFSEPGDVVADPFIGSGTTSVEALLLGRSALAADVSPFACLATRAKTTRIPCSVLEHETALVLSLLDNIDNKLVSGARFPLDEFWFDLHHLDQFETIRLLILGSVSPPTRDFFLLCLAATIRKFGFQDEAQIKVKRDQRKVASGTPSPVDVFRRQLPKQVERLQTFNRLLPREAHSCVEQQSADKPWKALSDADLIVTSPPYINAMNYPMTHRYENLLLGFVNASKSHDHDREYIGTERVRAFDYKVLRSVPSFWSCAETLNPLLERVYESEPKRSFICYEYFLGMQKAIYNWASLIKPGAKIVLVCGTNRIRGIPIDTVNILKSILIDAGMTQVTTFEYEIVKQSLRITRNATSDLINYDGVVVVEKPSA